MPLKTYQGTGRKPTGTRIVAVLFSTGKARKITTGAGRRAPSERTVSLVVLRPDTDMVGYRINERTADLALAQARHDGVDVTALHAIRDLPKWAQHRFFKAVGWQLDWTFLGWAIVKRRAAAGEAA